MRRPWTRLIGAAVLLAVACLLPAILPGTLGPQCLLASYAGVSGLLLAGSGLRLRRGAGALAGQPSSRASGAGR